MLEAAGNIPGAYYYGIHVKGEWISPEQAFLDEPADGTLRELLESVREYGDGNPPSTINTPVSIFDFDTMRPGRIFTTSGEQFRYLEDQGGGNHMIIREHVLENVAQWRGISWFEQEDALTEWFASLDEGFRLNHVQPVAEKFNIGVSSIADGEVNLRDDEFFATPGLYRWPIAAADRTEVVPTGVRRAFALSLADLNHLSRIEGIGFSELLDRRASLPPTSPTSPGARRIWWLRTPLEEDVIQVWCVDTSGELIWHESPGTRNSVGVRPALIIHQ